MQHKKLHMRIWWKLRLIIWLTHIFPNLNQENLEWGIISNSILHHTLFYLSFFYAQNSTLNLAFSFSASDKRCTTLVATLLITWHIQQHLATSPLAPPHILPYEGKSGLPQSRAAKQASQSYQGWVGALYMSTVWEEPYTKPRRRNALCSRTHTITCILIYCPCCI